ncbi:MAG: 3-hydroxyisobutyrate dehydrogenase [Ramlibacter sp.]|nr:3-hydroxyisobutyrate dehydrogenase [Ramlibacter sp.]
MMDVAFIGLGDMGEPMAHNLLAAGMGVTVFDTRKEPLDLAASKGASIARTLAEIPAKCGVIGLCVWSEEQLEQVLFGETGLFSSDAANVTLLIHSTVTPQFVERVATACAERGWTVLDAPVSGGRAGSVAGTLTLMVGGDKQKFDDCAPYFNAVGKNIFHVGSRPGAGAVAKLCNNLMALCNIFALAEAIKLAAAYGVEENVMLGAAKVSTGNSWWIENWGFFDNLILTHPQPDVLSKDLWEAVQAGKEKGLDLAIAAIAASTAPRLTAERIAKLKDPASR